MGERRLKISDVVRMTGLARNTVHALWADNAKMVQYETLDKICKALDIGITDLLEYVPGTKE